MEDFLEHFIIDIFTFEIEVIIDLLCKVINDHLEISIIILSVAFNIDAFIRSNHSDILLIQKHNTIYVPSDCLILIFDHDFPFDI